VTVAEPIAAYLAELAPQVPGGPLRRRRVLGEIETHLRLLVAEAEAGGASPTAAVEVAVERFGQPATVAAAFAAGEAGARPLRRQLRVLAVASAVAVALMTAGVRSHAPPAQAQERGHPPAGPSAAPTRPAPVCPRPPAPCPRKAP
jgi:hypothetical protein